MIVAGGYDELVAENKEYYQELKALVKSLGLEDHVSFLKSVSDAQKRTLLTHSTCLLYTPDREHFGIVPVEAMYLQCPVIAVNSGGPLETIVHNVTGFLVEPHPEAFAEAMDTFFEQPKLRESMGKTGKDWMEKKFSFTAFSKQLCDAIEVVTG